MTGHLPRFFLCLPSVRQHFRNAPLATGRKNSQVRLLLKKTDFLFGVWIHAAKMSASTRGQNRSTLSALSLDKFCRPVKLVSRRFVHHGPSVTSSFRTIAILSSPTNRNFATVRQMRSSSAPAPVFLLRAATSALSPAKPGNTLFSSVFPFSKKL